MVAAPTRGEAGEALVLGVRERKALVLFFSPTRAEPFSGALLLQAETLTDPMLVLLLLLPLFLLLVFSCSRLLVIRNRQ